MPTYRTPGVYFEWLDDEPSIQARRTDIAAFVGIAARGPLHKPVKVQSWTQFNSIFGGHTEQAFLAYAVEGFFANGGATCWVVRAADPDSAKPGRVALTGIGVGRNVFLRAISPGTWADELKVSAIPVGSGRIFLSLEMSGGVREVWQNLSLEPQDPRFIGRVLNDPVSGSLLVRVIPGNNVGPRRIGGTDGLASLRPEHLVGSGGAPEWGLATLEKIDEIGIVAIPDIMPVSRDTRTPRRPSPRCQTLESDGFAQPAEEKVLEFPPLFTPVEVDFMQRALIAHCEKLQDRFAVLDSRPEDRTPQSVLDWRKGFTSKYAALYFPWIKVSDPLVLQGLLRSMPPSGHVAGIYARVDLRTGVHKAPANEVMEGTEDVNEPMDDIEHGILNEGGVNLIRSYPGRGIRVAGARTLVSSDDRQWLYVNVRRLVIMIAEALDESTQWAVFEPNSPELWSIIDRAARGFLESLWQRGMLDGTTADEAFSVRCDSTTNPQQEIDLGRVICEIGLQPPWPAEFIVVRIGKTASGVEILNAMEAQGG